jgi:hypothetical protein
MPSVSMLNRAGSTVAHRSSSILSLSRTSACLHCGLRRSFACVYRLDESADPVVSSYLRVGSSIGSAGLKPIIKLLPDFLQAICGLQLNQPSRSLGESRATP